MIVGFTTISYTYCTYEYGVVHNNKDPKFKVGDCVRIPKYKNIFTKGYTALWSEEVFVIKGIKKYCTMDICYQ